MMRLIQSALIIAWLLSSPSAVFAQVEPDPPLKEVEAGVADVSPLSLSWREMQVDLRQPVGFENVYQVPGQEGMFMRVHGGLYAVFPQSVYANTREGEVAVIPNATVFYIGRDALRNASRMGLPMEQELPIDTRIMPEQVRRSVSQPPLYRPLDQRIAIDRIDPDAASAQRKHIEPTPTRIYPPTRAVRRNYTAHSGAADDVIGPDIVTDQTYRARRLRELMTLAATAGSGAERQ